ncbi:IS3 family transposase [Flavobacterium sharifuzzamanii]|uniref:IS3 family transposase n=1 Tax=Flavobacterium sharifuzzamanii TaxID=2211133 RepID=UPI000DAE92B5|nr:IS3 family transposase [Flavobacterium sharifuzzamanii]KAF2082006.1 IS3 family transposase [Flavobacterium sharifuzzamanii]
MKIYEQSFKEKAVRLSYERGEIKSLAKELGISRESLSSWRKKYDYLKLASKDVIIVELNKKIKDSEITLEILKNASEYVAQGKIMTKRFIENNSSKYPICKMCALLKMSSSAYYRRKKQEISEKQARIILLKEEVLSVYYEFKKTYGYLKITKELRRRGFKVGEGQVKVYMRMLGLRKRAKTRFRITTDSIHNHYVAPNILNREFTVNEPSKAWVSDITYIATAKGFLYLTIVLDLFDRKIIGWSLTDSMNTKETTLPAWEMAVKNRAISKDLIFHSDRGVQYANKIFTKTLDSYNCVRRSMSRRQNHNDNAVAESFFGNFKRELINGNKLLAREQMRVEVYEYIENWYNKKRRHSHLGYKTIEEFTLTKGNS